MRGRQDPRDDPPKRKLRDAAGGPVFDDRAGRCSPFVPCIIRWGDPMCFPPGEHFWAGRHASDLPRHALDALSLDAPRDRLQEMRNVAPGNSREGPPTPSGQHFASEEAFRLGRMRRPAVGPCVILKKTLDDDL
jgi:hypothetical protein